MCSSWSICTRHELRAESPVVSPISPCPVPPIAHPWHPTPTLTTTKVHAPPNLGVQEHVEECQLLNQILRSLAVTAPPRPLRILHGAFGAPLGPNPVLLSRCLTYRPSCTSAATEVEEGDRVLQLLGLCVLRHARVCMRWKRCKAAVPQPRFRRCKFCYCKRGFLATLDPLTVRARPCASVTVPVDAVPHAHLPTHGTRHCVYASAQPVQHCRFCGGVGG